MVKVVGDIYVSEARTCPSAPPDEPEQEAEQLVRDMFDQMSRDLGEEAPKTYGHCDRERLLIEYAEKHKGESSIDWDQLSKQPRVDWGDLIQKGADYLLSSAANIGISMAIQAGLVAAGVEGVSPNYGRCLDNYLNGLAYIGLAETAYFLFRKLGPVLSPRGREPKGKTRQLIAKYLPSALLVAAYELVLQPIVFKGKGVIPGSNGSAFSEGGRIKDFVSLLTSYLINAPITYKDLKHQWSEGFNPRVADFHSKCYR